MSRSSSLARRIVLAATLLGTTAALQATVQATQGGIPKAAAMAAACGTYRANTTYIFTSGGQPIGNLNIYRNSCRNSIWASADGFPSGSWYTCVTLNSASGQSSSRCANPGFDISEFPYAGNHVQATAKDGSGNGWSGILEYN